MLASAFGLALLVLQLFRTDVAQFNHYNHATRLVTHVCASLAAGSVSKEELCTVPIPKIAFFTTRYRALLEEDRAWFQERGWKFYPAVNCALRDPVYSFMDRDFVCRDGRAELIRDRESEAASEAGVGYCFKENPSKQIRTVMSVADDGTLVLENKERVVLAGIVFPGRAANTPPGASCGESIGYVKSKLEGQSVYVHAEEGAERDEQYRLPVYLVTFRGEFFNRELVRLGLAKAVQVGEGKPKPSCFEDFFGLEKAARTKKMGLWGTECLR